MFIAVLPWASLALLLFKAFGVDGQAITSIILTILLAFQVVGAYFLYRERYG
jgi:hypothetical protein